MDGLPGGVDRQVEVEATGRHVDGDLRQPRLLGNPFHAGVGPQVGEERIGRGGAVVEDEPVRLGEGSGVRKHGRSRIGQEVDVGFDGLRRLLAEAEDSQRDPGVVGRDRQVDRGAVADRLASLAGRICVEASGHEDL